MMASAQGGMMRIDGHLDGGPANFAGPAIRFVRPEDGAVVGDIPEAGAEGVARAMAAARAAFRAHRKAPSHKRAGWLRAGAVALAAEAEALAQIICEDVGKPIRAARFEARRAAEFMEATAAALSEIRGEVLTLDSVAMGEGRLGYTRRFPCGVVAAITPFNAPANLLVQKLAPALAAGNAVVVKPALAGTRAALLIVRAMEAAGLPAGMVNVLTGDRETALALAGHADVDAVTFTGGTEAGDALARAAGARRFVAELGSNAANVVLADADIAEAAKKIAGAAFEASGQQCISAQRVLVQAPAMEAFAEAFVAAAAGMKVGPAADPATDLGPMVSRAAAERVMAMVADATAQGARVLLEPRQDGATVSPGLLADVPRLARLWREEVFGPIAVLAPFDTVDEALQMANDSPFGLQGAVFTSSLPVAMRFAEDFEVGSLWVNEASRFRLDMYPFGGVKRSGTGREGVRYAIEELSVLKFVGITPGRI